jgi:GAF domain-containing protein
VADLGNVAAVLKKRLGFFWIGFYLLRDHRLVLGPFQGTPACVFLSVGEGVCGRCAERKETILVPDVHGFPGHVACDPNSKSEIVVPLFDESGVLRGVLDIDSNVVNAFDAMDQDYLEQVAHKIRGLWDSLP